MNQREGPNWVEYEIRTLRPDASSEARIFVPPKEYPDSQNTALIERALSKFLRQYFPKYDRGDVADLYIDRKEEAGVAKTYRVMVSFWPNAGMGQI